jgi:XTP/dITP diphosphohydrolase
MALDGKPGVYSARYAGLPANPLANTTKLLQELKGITNRRARFRTVISLILNSNTHFFEGTIDGNITLHPKGTHGFGYDPVFVPDGYNYTFAEMSIADKNQISHRSEAIRKLVHFLSMAD